MTVKMCNDCSWVGSGWFSLTPYHRSCRHPMVIEEGKARNPAGDGTVFVGIERTDYTGKCGREGRLWNTNKYGQKK